MIPGLERIRQTAKERKKERFTALLHHISPDLLAAEFFELKEDAAAGVDGLTWRAYDNRAASRPRALRTCMRPTSSGERIDQRRRIARTIRIRRTGRPLGVAALEDKIVLRARRHGKLNGIYEEGLGRLRRTTFGRAAGRMMHLMRSWSGSNVAG